MTVFDEKKKIAVIAGAGPAGLTAALELLRRSDVTPIVFEADDQVGGISKTINYRGNRMDLGGHRFFSKSDWVMRWWQEILPVSDAQTPQSSPLRIHYQGQARDLRPETLAPASAEAVMLVRQRLSRIFYRRRFFDYPLTLNAAHDQEFGAHRGIADWVELRQMQSFSRGVPKSPWKIFSSTASEPGCIAPSSRTIPRKYGAFPARRFPRNGALSASRACR